MLIYDQFDTIQNQFFFLDFVCCFLQQDYSSNADFVLISYDVVLKMTTILKEMRIAQLCSKNERTLAMFLGLIQHILDLSNLI